jgi:hypothetical protein
MAKSMSSLLIVSLNETLFEFKGWMVFGKDGEKGEMILIFRLGFAALIHDICAVYVPVVVTTTTCVGEPLVLVQTIERVSPGLRVTQPLYSEVGDEPLDEPLVDGLLPSCVGILLSGLPFRYAAQPDAPEPLGDRYMSLIVMALTPIAFMFTVSTPPNSSAVTVSVLLAPSDGIAPWKT